MENWLKSCVLVVVGTALLALAGCGGASTSQPSPSPAPILPCTVYPLWVMPTSVSIAQESSETVAVGLNGYVTVPGEQCSGFFTSPATVQASGLPDGVTVSPASIVITPTGPPQALTFSVSASATPESATIMLTGTSSTLTSSITVPLSIIPPPPPATMCPTSTLPPPPAARPAPHEWTWESGSSAFNQPGVYGIQGTPNVSNTPGARDDASTWTDAAGNLWLFGGYGGGSTGTQGHLNDLWEHTQGEWIWVGGSNLIEQAGTYGIQGTPAPGNLPGAREAAVSWTDPAGNFWLFGGEGLDSAGTSGDLNDLWKYNGGQWAWMSGSNTLSDIHGDYGTQGVYGTPGTPAPGNAPGARVGASSWADSCGNLWLFGGEGFDSVGAIGILNDLWKYSDGEWTWMSGANIVNQNGTYGALGTAAPGNVPGSRTNPVTWIDTSGNLWLFGGEGSDLNGILCEEVGTCDLNDLWEYSGGEWAWMGGSNVVRQLGTYGTQGVAAPGNVPGARWLAVSWADAAGNFWLFGGSGFDSVGTNDGNADLNDLWKYSGGEWAWMSGSDTANQFGTYGTQGTAAPGNVPGAREWAVGWIDPSGNVWLFGGFLHWVAPEGKFNDLWKYQP